MIKTINYNELDPNNFEPGFDVDLYAADYLKLSIVPDKPGSDEDIRHLLINREFIQTKSGLLLILELENKDTSERYNYVYSDIQRITVNDNFNQNFIKYYLDCTDRKQEDRIRDIKFSKEHGLPLSAEKLKILHKEPINRYRIMCLNE